MQEEKISTNVAETTGYSYGIKMNFSSMWQEKVVSLIIKNVFSF